MARITIEDCLEKVDNRFGLIHLSAKRVRQLRKGAEPLVVCKNRDIVVSLREIAAGKIFQDREKAPDLPIKTEKEAAPQELPEQPEGESPEEEQGDQEAPVEENER